MNEEAAKRSSLAERFASMKTWPDRWNGYRVKAPRHTAIDRAAQWLAEMEQVIPPEQWNEDDMLISDEGDGGVFLEVWHGIRKISLSIDETSIEGILIWGNVPHAKMTDLDILTTEDIVHAWAWIYALDQHAYEDEEPETT